MTLLEVGSTGPDVQKVQNALNSKLKLHLDADGIFGPATAAAVRQFQQQAGIDVDGQVGPATWRTLLGQAPPASPHSQGGGHCVSAELVAAVAKFEGGQGKTAAFTPTATAAECERSASATRRACRHRARR